MELLGWFTRILFHPDFVIAIFINQMLKMAVPSILIILTIQTILIMFVSVSSIKTQRQKELIFVSESNLPTLLSFIAFLRLMEQKYTEAMMTGSARVS